MLVDMREFRSKLPSLLFQADLAVLPITIEVGDYVLSPDVCVERKSVSDLIGSLASGRLHNQSKALTKLYKVPVLLIEVRVCAARVRSLTLRVPWCHAV